MDQPPYPPGPPAPPPSRRRPLAFVLGALVVAVALGAGILIGNSGDNSSPKASKASTGAASAADAPSYWQDEENEEPEYATVDENSFTVELRTKSRQCYGYSVGCNVMVEPEITYLGSSEDLDPAATYEITYEITGDEDGPVVDTMDLTDQTDLSYTPTLISTASTGTEVSVEITDVLTR